MSTKYYNKLWVQAQTNLNEVIEKELPQEKTLKTERVRRKSFHYISQMYIQYIDIMSKLDRCYDQMIQPQKRLLVRKLLDLTVGRILELKNEIVTLEISEILCFDAVLTEMNLTHDALEIPIPKYFTQDCIEELKSRNDTMDTLLVKYGLREKSDDDVVSSVEEAVCLIQKMERARQGKLRAHFMKEIYEQHQKEKTKGSGGLRNPKETTSELQIVQQRKHEEQQQTTIDPHNAALKIQQIWKGYTTWKKIQKEREEEMIFLGMIPDRKSIEKNKQLNMRIETIENLRRERQHVQEKLYEEALVNVKQEILRKEGFDIMETMRKDIRSWFFTYKERTGKLPDYPTVDQGGYEAILAKGSEAYEEPKQKTKSKKLSKATSKGSVGRLSSGSKHSAGSTGSSGRPPQSALLPDMVAANAEYKNIWEERTINKQEEIHDETIVEKEKRNEVTKELRLQVDVLMRQELERFKIALLRDKGKKGKKLRAALRKEQKKTKKKKQKTAKKKRKEKDLTPHRTLEMLYEELVKEGIVKKYPHIPLKSYLGEPNYLPLNPEKKKEFIGTKFSQADIRRFITEYCILPLGCKEIRQRVPTVKSVLIVGPPRSGKTMLVNAVCSEVGATLFDLTATNLVGKYPGREGLKMLLHLVSKVGRLLQPTVILIDDVDKMFMKKIPKTDKTDPKRIKKGLQKLMKVISIEDRIFLIGTCQCPAESDIKGLGGMFSKIVCISKPDHASRYALWQKLIQNKGGHIRNGVDISTLTKVSDGYSSGSIALAISQVLTPHRVALQKRRVLQVGEFLTTLAKFTPVFKEEELAIQNWYLRTPIVRKKIASLEPEEKRSARTKKKEQAKVDEKSKKKKAKGKKK